MDTINLWLYSLVLKVVPCFVLTVFTGFLVKALYKAEERSARLKVCLRSKKANARLRDLAYMPFEILDFRLKVGDS